MPIKYIDFIGHRFGRLVVIEKLYIKKYIHYNCLCDCGKTKIVYRGNLKQGKTKSCGCLEIEARFTHGKGNTDEYHAWENMKARCYNEKFKYYRLYGGRGIVVCEEWRNSFENFYADMGLRPSKKHSLDRIENDKKYSKENCKWSTKKEQANNTSRNVFLEFNGMRKTIGDWGLYLGGATNLIHGRLANGWTMERALTEIKDQTKVHKPIK